MKFLILLEIERNCLKEQQNTLLTDCVIFLRLKQRHLQCVKQNFML